MPAFSSYWLLKCRLQQWAISAFRAEAQPDVAKAKCFLDVSVGCAWRQVSYRRSSSSLNECAMNHPFYLRKPPSGVAGRRKGAFIHRNGFLWLLPSFVFSFFFLHSTFRAVVFVPDGLLHCLPLLNMEALAEMKTLCCERRSLKTSSCTACRRALVIAGVEVCGMRSSRNWVIYL